jgi:hypothetical protein
MRIGFALGAQAFLFSPNFFLECQTRIAAGGGRSSQSYRWQAQAAGILPTAESHFLSAIFRDKGLLNCNQARNS